ncbi:MAG: hypothetical protein IT195_10925 [Microthrixaceae bacterium]|nr:hypothetical protein [Microthrixaceae bacterium]
MPDAVVPLELEVLAEGWPTLVWCPVEVTAPSGAVDRYQLVLALHRIASAASEPEALIGVVAAPAGTAHVYDALGDAAGSLLLAHHVAPDIKVEAPDPRRRRDGRTSSVAFDDRWELTVYRHLDDGAEADVALPLALGRRGVAAVNPPVATWHRHGWDLAALRRESGHGPDGIEVARRSLSELFARRCPPQDCRADIRADAERLGAAVAEVHLGLAETFETESLTGRMLRRELLARARRCSPGRLDLSGIGSSLERLDDVAELGVVIRVHGELHLSNVERERRQWHLRGFVRPGEHDTRRSSPLRDVAAITRGLRQAAVLAAAERSSVAPRTPLPGLDVAGERMVEREGDRELALLADAWAERAIKAFVAGYAATAGVHRLLPEDRTARDAVLALYELTDDLDLLKWEFARRSVVVDLREASGAGSILGHLVDKS